MNDQLKRIVSIVIILCCFAGLSFAQQNTLTIDVENANLEKIFELIEKQTSYKFSYRNIIIDKTSDINLKVDQATISEVLQAILPQKGLQYDITSEKSIVITPLPHSTNLTGTPKKISGKITDDTGESIIGANIKVEGSTVGTISDFNGNFEIEVPENGSISITYIGYDTQLIKVDGKTHFDIVLRENAKELEEVVVVGYGTQKKLNLTGSVSMVTSDDLDSRPVSSVSSGLQGLLSGVTVVNVSGQPGANNSSIRIRGLGTIGNANPLVLIDGVEGDMNTLNPEDIQSISVLKDAASSSIYGARAANGVILVTTKKLNVKGAAPTIFVNAYYGSQTPTRLPEMADAIDFMKLDNEARANVGTGKAWTDQHFDHVINNTEPNYFGNTNWIAEVLNKHAPQQNYSVNLNGTLGNSGYLISYRYFDQAGLTVGNSTGEQRHNLRFKVNSRLLDKVEISSNIGYTMQDVISPIGSLTSGGGAIYTAMRIAPNAPVYYTDGSWAYGGGNTNPVAILHDGGNTTLDADEMSLLNTAKIELLEGWDVTATYSIVNRNTWTDILKKNNHFYQPGNTGNTSIYL